MKRDVPEGRVSYSRYIVMVDEILDDDRLTPFQKILWALIDTLSRKGDPCVASNSYLADRMKTSQGNLANELSKLRAFGLLLDESQEDGKRGLITVYEGDRRIQERILRGVQSGLKQGSATTEPSISHSLSKQGAPNKGQIKVENKERTIQAMAEVGKRVKKIFKRKENDAWSYLEERYLFEVCQREDAVNEIGEIEKLYSSPGRHFVSESASKLLENWTQMLDKARNPRNEINRFEPPSRNEGTYNDGDPTKYEHRVYGYKPPQGPIPDQPDQGGK